MVRGSIYDCLDFGHYFIFLAEYSRGKFLGIMLTSKWRHNNVPLRNPHFKKVDSEGHPFLIKYRSSHFPYALLIKRSDVKGLNKVGELSDEGISYVVETLERQKPITWEAFKRREKINLKKG